MYTLFTCKIKSKECIQFFGPLCILQHRFVLKYRQTGTLFLGIFEYTEADREIYRKWITKCKQYSTTFHVRVSNYFTYSIIICSSLFITLRYVTLRTSQNLTKDKNYLYYMEGTVGSIWHQAEINIKKKRKDTRTSECVWHR
jgi:hypothetical protein